MGIIARLQSSFGIPECGPEIYQVSFRGNIELFYAWVIMGSLGIPEPVYYCLQLCTCAPIQALDHLRSNCLAMREARCGGGVGGGGGEVPLRKNETTGKKKERRHRERKRRRRPERGHER